MGRTVALYFTDPIREDDFKSFVAEVGGCVTDDAELEVWFKAGDASVWIYRTRRALAGQFEPPSEEEIAALGAGPTVGLYLTLSHEVESGPLALRLSLAILRRWDGVASAATGGVFGGDELSKLVTARVVLNSFCIYCAKEPLLQDLLKQFDAMTIDPELMPGAHAALRQIPLADFDPDHETVVALIAAGANEDVWVVRSTEPHVVPPSAFEEYVQRQVEGALLGPRSKLRLILRRDPDSRQADRTAVRFATMLLGRQPGVVAGWFDRTLGVDELERVLKGPEQQFVT